jgi:hypothetical protein
MHRVRNMGTPARRLRTRPLVQGIRVSSCKSIGRVAFTTTSVSSLTECWFPGPYQRDLATTRRKRGWPSTWRTIRPSIRRLKERFHRIITAPAPSWRKARRFVGTAPNIKA